MPPNANKEIYDLPAPIQRIRAKMQAKHISQQDLCDWLHMSSSSISRLLQGESTLTFDVAVVISQHLGMSLDEIAGHSSSNDQHNIDAVINLYENRLTAVRATHSRLVSEIKEAHAQEIASLCERYDELQQSTKEQYELRVYDLKRDRKILRIVLYVLFFIFFAVVVFDFLIGSHGWIQYAYNHVIDGAQSLFSSHV